MEYIFLIAAFNAFFFFSVAHSEKGAGCTRYYFEILARLPRYFYRDLRPVLSSIVYRFSALISSIYFFAFITWAFPVFLSGFAHSSFKNFIGPGYFTFYAVFTV